MMVSITLEGFVIELSVLDFSSNFHRSETAIIFNF